MPSIKSRVPAYEFPSGPSEQEEALKSNPLLQRMNLARKAFAGDKYRPGYHYVNPESTLNDPNGLCYWNGNWHLFYQGYPPEDPRVHWGHAISDDLVHWRDLPYAIYPDIEESCYSGATLVEANRVIAMYHGTKAGNMIAISDDPLLLNWSKIAGNPVIPIVGPSGSDVPYSVFDPCIWSKGDFYYALSAGTKAEGPAGKPLRANYLFRSGDLEHWEYLHPFVENDRFTLVGDDGACPYFWPIGDRYILLFFSHMSGGQYLLGDYDLDRDKFIVSHGGKFNHGAAAPSGVHAPSATPDGRGGIVAIFNMNAGKPTVGWNQIMTLPRRLTVNGDNIGIEPAGDLAALRVDEWQASMLDLPENREIVLDQVEGDSMELELTIDLQAASMFELNVLRSPDRQEYTRIAVHRDTGLRNSSWVSGHGYQANTNHSTIVLDPSRASLAADVSSRPPEMAQMPLGSDEPLKLRVFVDRSVVEVFANGRQCLAVRVYPERNDSIGVSLRSHGGASRVRFAGAYGLKSIW